MYESYFGLNSKPFTIVPDTRFLYLSSSHREAIAHLVYALNEKNGFVQLTGEVGVGKTMACRYLLANVPHDVNVALVLNPQLDEQGLLKTICDELQISYTKQDAPGELTSKINQRLLHTHSQDRHTILIVDEAQNLPKKTLEQVRLLTNLETDQQKLLRIILIGQPELAELLSHQDMRQVAQRITSRYHLGTLSKLESDEYIKHRLGVAGCKNPLFTNRALKKIYRLTKGTPRLINLLCDRALIGAYSLGVAQVDTKIVKAAAKEALPITRKITKEKHRPLLKKTLFAFILIALLLLSVYSLIETWWPRLKPFLAPPQVQSTIPSAPDNKIPSVVTVNEIEENGIPLNPVKHDQIEEIKRQADVDLRLGIPARIPKP